MRSVRVGPIRTRWGHRAFTLHYPVGLWDWVWSFWIYPGRYHIDGFGRDCKIELHDLTGERRRGS